MKRKHHLRWRYVWQWGKALGRLGPSEVGLECAVRAWVLLNENIGTREEYCGGIQVSTQGDKRVCGCTLCDVGTW